MSSPKGGLRPFQPCKFARYTLLQPIAKGGMGEVFLAQMTGAEGFEKLIVIKKILAELAKEGDFVQRFVAEAKILMQLHHGAIAQILDMGVEGGSYYIAMEFVNGKDLRKLLSRTRETKARMPAGLALHIIVRILDALAYAHRKTLSDGSELNLVHRDISPQNILVSYEGEVKLIDFGLAKSSAAQQQKTRAGMVVGKIFYMAPEQALHEIVDKRSDLYSAGICLWEMLAGKNPFDTGESALMLMHRVANPEVPSIRTVRPDLPQSLDELLQKAIAPDPAERFASAEEMRGRLTAVMMEIDPMAGPESLASYMGQLFAADVEKERRNIAALSKAIPKSAPATEPTPAPNLSSSRQIPTEAAASARRPEPLRPLVQPAAQTQLQDKQPSGKRPRRTHDQVPVDKPASRPQEPARASTTAATRSTSDKRASTRTDPKSRQTVREPATAEAPKAEVKVAAVEPLAAQRIQELVDRPNRADERREDASALPPQTSGEDKSGSAKWMGALIAGLVIVVGAGAGVFAMMSDSKTEAPSQPQASTPLVATPVATPKPQSAPRPRPKPSRPKVDTAPDTPPPLPLPKDIKASAPPSARAPDKARAALRRDGIPSDMQEISEVFQSLSAELIALKAARGCAQLAMMCEFHDSLSTQHERLVKSSKQAIKPPTFLKERRDFWESLKVLEASLSEQRK